MVENVEGLQPERFDPLYYLYDGLGSTLQLVNGQGEVRPLSQNRYIYVENNPVNYVDPSGHEPIFYGAEREYLQQLLDSATKTTGKDTSQSNILDVLNKIEDVFGSYKESQNAIRTAPFFVSGLALTGNDILYDSEEITEAIVITASAIGFMEFAQWIPRYWKNKDVYKVQKGKREYTTKQPPKPGPNKPSGGKEMPPPFNPDKEIHQDTGLRWDMSNLSKTMKEILKWVLGTYIVHELIKPYLKSIRSTEEISSLIEMNKFKDTISYQK